MDIWAPVHPEEGTSYAWQIEHLALWIRKYGDECFINSIVSEKNPGKKIIAQKTNSPADGLSRRILVNESWDKISLSPLMPDRPVVVEPEYAIQIPPGCRIDLFICVPLCLSVKIETKKRQIDIAELQTRPLSNTWYGDHSSGILCYSHKTSLFRSIDETSCGDFEIICPVTVSNLSDKSLHLKKVLVDVPFLNIYRQKNYFITDTEIVDFISSEEVRFDYQKKTLKEGIKLVTSPKNPAGRGLLQKSIKLLFKNT